MIHSLLRFQIQARCYERTRRDVVEGGNTAFGLGGFLFSKLQAHICLRNPCC